MSLNYHYKLNNVLHIHESLHGVMHEMEYLRNGFNFRVYVDTERNYMQLSFYYLELLLVMVKLFLARLFICYVNNLNYVFYSLKLPQSQGHFLLLETQ